MSAIKIVEKEILKIYKECGYEVDEVILLPSNRKDLGDYQLNDAMKLAKIYHKNPIEIAKEIVEKLKQDDKFCNVNIAGAGFINISFSNKFLINYVEELKTDIKKDIDILPSKKIIIDYGGANCAKALHVGHLRSANIGEAIKRIAKLVGMEVIGDTHLGDSGFNAGATVMEMEDRYPNLICFKEGYNGEDFILPITKEDLNKIYPAGSKKAKEDEELLERARNIALEIQNNNLKYSVLWNKIKDMSIENIKATYERLNCSFELFEGELDSFKYIPDMLKDINNKGLLNFSEGAKVMDVSASSDTKEIPPIILVKSNGAYLYGTTDLGTIVGRVKRFNPDEIWYVTDIRQSLHFEQVFRAARKAGIVDSNTKLLHFGFGTVNGKDGKPFKTRDGGVMNLDDLIDMVKEESRKRINVDVVGEENIEETAEKIAVSSLKYADLLSHRATDYIFDPEKFSDLEGKTAPYLMYSTLRIKSLLNKADIDINNISYTDIKSDTEKEIILTLLDFNATIIKAFNNKTPNDVADYIYKLTSLYNKFYSENRILTEEDIDLKNSWLVLSNLVYKTNLVLLDVLGLILPEKM